MDTKVVGLKPLAFGATIQESRDRIVLNLLKNQPKTRQFQHKIRNQKKSRIRKQLNLCAFGFSTRRLEQTATCSICVHGEISGFYKGDRVLRQGDPISLYLFTLIMEVFNMIMTKNISESSLLKYHYGCKELKLTHMCFADDLMVLCNGDKESLKVVKKSLEEFSNVFGLFPNLNKSIIFFGSISEGSNLELLQVLPFKCGHLPMKYLRVPLVSKRLGVNDCRSLIDNVEKRNNW
nr:RNA-directed DNA polymerase, eukaryota, reverse transcriptase zinc-binding domain protein [Tanacetum cinerariifolium]